MKNVRLPDLNIVTAEWVGWGGRTSQTQKSHMKTILASIDPVALDYCAAKYVLLPATRSGGGGKELILLNNPDDSDSVFRKFLVECHKQGIGTLEEDKMKISIYDFQNNIGDT